ncbi:MAG: hypothetical protein J3K34DRAFT_524964 [Monoraphidium minutum]|nr:MAG: hypothetical protein J3K34DRAFT_524964 [Monoraphidium minutum]
MAAAPAQPLLGDESEWHCPICLALLYKPCINTCGHAACFWCMHQAMNPYEPSACPLCRAEFAHFPRVCPRLHALLGAAFPEAYARRAEETAEEEAERGAESEAVARDPPLAASAAAAAAAPAALDGLAAAAAPPPVFGCDGCRRLLLEPSALPCGHVVCRACVPREGGGSPPAGAGAGAAGARCCPACALAVTGDPGVVILLDKLLRARLPEATAARAHDLAAAAGAAPRGGAAGGGGGEAAAQSAAPPEPHAAAAAAAGGGGARRRAPPPEVAALLASGRPMREIWPDLERALSEVADERYTWHAVGCDDCGAYPIVGRRYRCTDCPEAIGYHLDCPEAIGYDLCGACRDRGPAGAGRFNQQHRPGHRLEKLEPRASWVDIHEPQNLSTLVNLLQMVHPDLTTDRIMSLLWMQMEPERVAAAAQAAAARGARVEAALERAAAAQARAREARARAAAARGRGAEAQAAAAMLQGPARTAEGAEAAARAAEAAAVEADATAEAAEAEAAAADESAAAADAEADEEMEVYAAQDAVEAEDASEAAARAAEEASAEADDEMEAAAAVRPQAAEGDEAAAAAAAEAAGSARGERERPSAAARGSGGGARQGASGDGDNEGGGDSHDGCMLRVPSELRVGHGGGAGFAAARALLAGTSLGEYLSSKPPSAVLTLTTAQTAGQALRALAAANVLSAPLLDAASGGFVGFLDLNDILRAFLGLVNVRELSDDNREYRLRTAGLQLDLMPLSQIRTGLDGALLYKAAVSSSLLDVVRYGFLLEGGTAEGGGDDDAPESDVVRYGFLLEGGAAEPGGDDGAPEVVHRVGVFDIDASAATTATEEPDDDDGGGDDGAITQVVSQSDVIAFLCRRADGLGPLAGRSLVQLGLGAKAVVCVPGEMSTINAFATMAANRVSCVGANRVSCVGVIAHDGAAGTLGGHLSSSDLRGLLPQHFPALALPVMQFLSLKASSGWPHAAAPRGAPGAAPANEWGLKGHEALSRAHVISCGADTTLRAALQLIAANRRRPVSLVTLTDLLRALVGWRPRRGGPDDDDDASVMMPGGAPAMTPGDGAAGDEVEQLLAAAAAAAGGSGGSGGGGGYTPARRRHGGNGGGAPSGVTQSGVEGEEDEDNDDEEEEGDDDGMGGEGMDESGDGEAAPAAAAAAAAAAVGGYEGGEGGGDYGEEESEGGGEDDEDDDVLVEGEAPRRRAARLRQKLGRGGGPTAGRAAAAAAALCY